MNTPAMPLIELERNALSVSDFVAITDRCLKNLGSAVVIGEISELKPYAHLYFKIKDENSAVDCLLFKSAWQKLGFKPQIGQKVIILGSSSLYSKNGSFKLIVRQMHLSGLGTIMAQLEELKRKLAQEGLFSKPKRKLPYIINCVGLVTSEEGSVLHDMRTTILRRNPLIKTKLFKTLVQGEGAPEQIVAALNRAYQDPDLDAVILARGGGSFEDLLCFSDERVVRKTAQSPYPIISAIGHEPDTALTDFAADLRAPTPTAAAEQISTPTLKDIDDLLLEYQRRFAAAITEHFNFLFAQLDLVLMRLGRCNPDAHISRLQGREAWCAVRLSSAMAAIFHQKNARLSQCKERLAPYAPEQIIRRRRLQIDSCTAHLNLGMQKRLSLVKENLSSLSFRLNVQVKDSLGLMQKDLDALELRMSKHSPALRLSSLNRDLIVQKERLASLLALRINAGKEEINALQTRLDKAAGLKLSLSLKRLESLNLSLSKQNPAVRLDALRLQLSSCQSSLTQAVNLSLNRALRRDNALRVRLMRSGVEDRMHKLYQRWQSSVSKLAALNPLQVLKRGYSVTLKDGRQALSLKEGDEIVTLLSGQKVASMVFKVEPFDPSEPPAL